jgi:hypothetical protein
MMNRCNVHVASAVLAVGQSYKLIKTYVLEKE